MGRETGRTTVVQLRQARSDRQQLAFADAMSKFACRDKGVELFLKEKAWEFERRNFARTYLLLDAEEAGLGNVVITSYFTLSIKALQFLPSLSKRKVKQIDGFSKDASSVGAVLIGQLGKDSVQGNYVTGNHIMTCAFEVIYKVFEAAACRIAFLECEPIEKLIEFYNLHGFDSLQNTSGGLLQMVRTL